VSTTGKMHTSPFRRARVQLAAWRLWVFVTILVLAGTVADRWRDDLTRTQQPSSDLRRADEAHRGLPYDPQTTADATWDTFDRKGLQRWPRSSSRDESVTDTA